MKQESNFSGFYFNMWSICSNSTYPALLSLNNAPFAFADTFTIGASIHISLFLENDYDYETLQDSLVLAIDSISAGRVENNVLYLPEGISTNDTVMMYYRVGELSATDTLWGNQAHSIVIAGTNSAPVLLSNNEQTDEDSTLNILLTSLVNDNENDEVTIELIDSTVNGALTLSKDFQNYIPEKNYNGIDSVLLKLSDGLLTDSVWVVVDVNTVNDAPEINFTAPLTAIVDETYIYSFGN